MKSKFSHSLALAAVAVALMAATAASSGHARPFNLAQSKLTVYVYKQGIFAFAADNHVVNAPIASGSLNEATHAVEMSVDAATMRVLDPKMPPDRRARVQANMVGPDVLDATKYPRIAFRSTRVDPAPDGHWNVTGDLMLHGQTHPVSFRVDRVDAAHFNGSTTIKQTTFGITPIRIAGGTVKVKDELKIAFQIVLR